MIKISSKDIQEASEKFQIFLKDVVNNYLKSEFSVYRPDDKILAKKHGFKFLGAGCYRAAFKYKNVVIKTHLHADSRTDITKEKNIWNKHKHSLTSAIINPVLFCKTIAFKNADMRIAYSVSPYVKTHDGAKKKDKHVSYKKFLNRVSNSIYDGHSGNIGILNKLPILIDYQEGTVKFDTEYLSYNDVNALKKQRLALMSLVRKASA
jgi:hypothetical protein